MSKHDRIPAVDAETVIELSDGLSVVCSDIRRQHLLAELSSGDDVRTLDSLAAAVATASSRQRSETEIDERVTVTLHHCHLPKLADRGLVEYDSDRREARLTAKGNRCVEVFRQMQNA